MQGLITKGIGGFYFVDTQDGSFRAKGRGIFKKDKDVLMVGDLVEAAPPGPGEDDGIILNILPRKNMFRRPPLSNIDKMIVMFALRDPEPNLETVDKLLVMAEFKGIEPIVCLNKMDLGTREEAQKILNIYKDIYPTIGISCNWNNNILSEMGSLVGKSKVAIAGPSGVGKSTLTNILIPKAVMETGEISRKTQRGRHTTRHVEIFPFGEGYIFDTPGFTSFDLEDIQEQDLGSYFPEIADLAAKCRFNDCYHLEEPDCQVIRGLEQGIISRSRYDSYRACLGQIRKRR